MGKVKVKPPKTVVRDGKVLQLKKTYVLLDDEGQVIRHQPHQFPHAKLRRGYIEVLDLNTFPEAPF